jgi:hypothetical protein
MLDFETVRTWERNPQLYADMIGTSLATQALFAYAPEANAPAAWSRSCGRCRAWCRPRRDNIKDCPGIFVKIGLETWRGTLKFIETISPRLHGARRPAHPR